MRMFRNLLLTGAAAVLLLGGTAKAATIVTSDAGNFASFTLTNNGDGTYTLTLTPPATLTTINGTVVNIAATFDTTITFGATVSGSEVTVTSGGGPYTKTFGDGTAIASLSYNIQAGLIGSGINSNGFLLSGTILSLSPNALPDYDFSGLLGGTNTFALTGAQYTGGATSIADVFSIGGASVSGSGGFSENASLNPIPEPTSMGLLGIGLSGLFTVRRFFSRRSVVA